VASWGSTFDLFPAVLGPRQCDAVVAMGESALAAARAGTTTRGAVVGDAHDGVRDSAVAWLGRDDGSEWLFAKLEALAARANRRWGLELRGFEEELQFTDYDRPGAHYSWHHDGLDAGVEHRKLSIVVQLSGPADYDGAALEFLEVVEDWDAGRRSQWEALARARGSAVVFPAFEYHRVTPLRRGRRRSLVAWVSGPPFR
jgi:PKHD-type hydroxylase